MPHAHALLKHAGADAHEGEAVAVSGIHVGLNLEDEAGELVRGGIDGALVGDARRRGLGVAEEALQEGLHAEVVGGRAEEHGRELSGEDLLQVELVARHVQQLDVLHQLLVVALADDGLAVGIVDADLLHLDLGLTVIAALVELDHAGVAVVEALEVAVDADGPVHGAGADAQHLLDLLHQVEGIASGAVHLVDEGEDRNGAQAADLEQLHRLLLHALGVVDEHHGAVRGHQRAVGILGEVLMSGGIQNVDAVAVEVELHRRGRDRNAALLLDLHPVRRGVVRRLAGLDRARQANGPAVEQQLLGQRRLTSVRVRDDGERSPARHFLFQFGMQHYHSSSLKISQLIL